MRIPSGMTEQQVLETIDSVIGSLCRRFQFGYHELDDMKQKARMIAIEALDKYDENKPLPNFIWSVVHNGLFNFKRDNYQRPDKPCIKCPLSAYLPPNGCSAFNDKMDCELYAKWFNKNIFRFNVMKPIGLNEVDDVYEDNMKSEDSTLNTAVKVEIFDIWRRKLPKHLVKDYLRLKSGVKIPKKIEDEIKIELKKIVDEHNLEL
jgi:DNA-directed RNA polymerase specialized sigma24 family protein